VIASGKPRVSMDRANKRIEVDLALRDVGGETVGSLALAWRFPVAGSQAEFERIAGTIRDALARRILNVGNLMEPYPSSPRQRPRHARRHSWTKHCCGTPK